MTSVALCAPASSDSRYEQWYRHFFDNRDASRSLPWEDSYRLTVDELKLVGASIQQFQLGEYARGRGFLRRASAHPVFAADSWFLPTLQLFIAEEQGHSAMLGRFLDREGIPRLEAHWIDGVFRRLRKLAGLEVCVMALVTAEVLAIPFYRALRDATRSPLLRAICVRILCDEVDHLNYQALTVGLIRRPLSQRAQAIRSFCHATLFRGTALLLWQQHCTVFKAAGWDFRRFWKDSLQGFARLRRCTLQIALGRTHDTMRLD